MLSHHLPATENCRKLSKQRAITTWLGATTNTSGWKYSLDVGKSTSHILRAQAPFHSCWTPFLKKKNTAAWLFYDGRNKSSWEMKKLEKNKWRKKYEFIVDQTIPWISSSSMIRGTVRQRNQNLILKRFHKYYVICIINVLFYFLVFGGRRSKTPSSFCTSLSFFFPF